MSAFFSEDELVYLKEKGIEFTVTGKMCDFCGCDLPKDHPSVKCKICPTLFDECDKCQGHVVCHLPSHSEAKRLPKVELARMYGEGLSTRWKDPSDNPDLDVLGSGVIENENLREFGLDALADKVDNEGCEVVIERLANGAVVSYIFQDLEKI